MQAQRATPDASPAPCLSLAGGPPEGPAEQISGGGSPDCLSRDEHEGLQDLGIDSVEEARLQAALAQSELGSDAKLPTYAEVVFTLSGCQVG